jgi:hypothetical protein
VNDEPLDRLILQVERGMEESARKAWALKRSGWSADSTIQWLSDCVDLSGQLIRPIWRIEGYGWVETLVYRLALRGKYFLTDMRTMRPEAALGAHYKLSDNLEDEAIYRTTPLPGVLRDRLVFRRQPQPEANQPLLQVGRVDETFIDEDGEPAYQVEWLKVRWDQATRDQYASVVEGWITWQAAPGGVWPARCSEDREVQVVKGDCLLPIIGAVLPRSRVAEWRGGVTWWKLPNNPATTACEPLRIPMAVQRIFPPEYINSPRLECSDVADASTPSKEPRRSLTRLIRGPSVEGSGRDGDRCTGGASNAARYSPGGIPIGGASDSANVRTIASGSAIGSTNASTSDSAGGSTSAIASASGGFSLRTGAPSVVDSSAVASGSDSESINGGVVGTHPVEFNVVDSAHEEEVDGSVSRIL